MSHTPRVSVIVASYNYGQYIGDALRSVQAQTFTEWECIVVDDASTDGTPAIVQGFAAKDQRIRYVRMDRNEGVAAARNKGLGLAHGEYVQLLDADDQIAPRKLELHVAWLLAHPGTDIVYSDHVRFVDVADFRLPGLLAPDERVSGRAALRRAIKGNFLRLNAVLFRTGMVQDIGGFRSHFRYVEDWDFWLRAMAMGHNLQFLDEPLAIAAVRNTPDSLSKNLPAMRRFHLPVRQSLWITGQLTLGERLSLLARYVDYLWEMVLVKREPVVVEKEGRWTFFPMALLVAIMVLPLWLMVRATVRR